jgi:polyphosphate kinase
MNSEITFTADNVLEDSCSETEKHAGFDSYAQGEASNVSSPRRFLNREASWLAFAMRLLDLSGDMTIPLLERAKFLAIFSSGLDEFLQVRVAGIKEQIAVGLKSTSPDGMYPEEQLDMIRSMIKICIKRANRIFTAHLQPALQKEGIRITDYAALPDDAKSSLKVLFTKEIFPVLTPLAVDPGHPFPYISNLSLNIAVFVVDNLTGDRRFARVKVPTPLLPRYVSVGGENENILVPLEQVIAAHLSDLFPQMEVESSYAFRVVRNADLDFDEDEADDLLEAIELELRKRRRFGRAVCIEVQSAMPQEMREVLLGELELEAGDCYEYEGQLDFSSLWMLYDLNRFDLKYPDWTPAQIPDLISDDPDGLNIFDVLRGQDILVHHPYESFAASVETFIAQASTDESVLAIKQTLYRTSGDAPFVSSLSRAVESGKQVAALVELKARFDEDKNITWAKQLERAGVHVVYGLVGLKTHSKTVLVVRKEPDGIKRYVHIGTGNYNSKTARIYEDMGILSSSEKIGADLTDLFNYLTGFSRPSKTRSIILAPDSLRNCLLQKIQEQAMLGPEGEIVLKANGLTDPQIIDSLYQASQQGTKIILIIRGICSLRPQVKGLSENITVRSIVGRFLEHSRIYRFGRPNFPDESASELFLARQLQKGNRDILDALEQNILVGGAKAFFIPNTNIGENHQSAIFGAQYFMGSADLMERNFDRRIEAVIPIENVSLCARLEGILQMCLLDDLFSWELQSDSSWVRKQSANNISAQNIFMQLSTYNMARKRHLDEMHRD